MCLHIHSTPKPLVHTCIQESLDSWCKKWAGVWGAHYSGGVEFPGKRKRDPGRAQHPGPREKEHSASPPPLLTLFGLLREGLYDPGVLSEFVLDHPSSLMWNTHHPKKANAGDSHSLTHGGDGHRTRLDRRSSSQI